MENKNCIDCDHCQPVNAQGLFKCKILNYQMTKKKAIKKRFDNCPLDKKEDKQLKFNTE